MAEIQKLRQIESLPGVKRDGTTLDGDQFSEGQWMRFQRGRPKKMGGYQLITDRLYGPVRDMLVWARAGMSAIYSFSPQGIQMLLVDGYGLGSSITDRTPASGFTADDNFMWSTDTLYNSAGSTTAVLAHAAATAANIDDPTEYLCYYGAANGSSAFTSVGAIGPSGTGVSGGVFCSPPFAFYYGSDGYLQWCDENQPTVLDSGAADASRVTGAKIVKGFAQRSGSGPGGLLWSLDSVVRLDYQGGASIFRASHLSTQSSVLSQNGVVEYDGVFYWPGVDRFLMCDGSKVAELPNQMNLNWFFDNLNYDQRQLVWGMKITRFGEIHWFYPHGDVAYCNRSVIYNVREQIWYDNELARSAGYPAQVFKYPVMAGSIPSTANLILDLTISAGTISIGDSVVGDTSGTVATVYDIDGTYHYVTLTLGGTEYTTSEGLTDLTSGATATVDATIALYEAFLHEKGTDAIKGDVVSAIESYFTTADFGLPTGGPQPGQPGLNRWTRLVRVEPDFVQEGAMTVEVIGREFPNADETVTTPKEFTNDTTKIDLRTQARQIQLKFTSNVAGGHYEMGRVVLHTEPGDVRS